MRVTLTLENGSGAPIADSNILIFPGDATNTSESSPELVDSGLTDSAGQYGTVDLQPGMVYKFTESSDIIGSGTFFTTLLAGAPFHQPIVLTPTANSAAYPGGSAPSVLQFAGALTGSFASSGFLVGSTDESTSIFGGIHKPSTLHLPGVSMGASNHTITMGSITPAYNNAIPSIIAYDFDVDVWAVPAGVNSSGTYPNAAALAFVTNPDSYTTTAVSMFANSDTIYTTFPPARLRWTATSATLGGVITVSFLAELADTGGIFTGQTGTLAFMGRAVPILA